MADISILELLVYALVGYSGLIMLISSSFREIPATKSQSTVRSIWVLAPMFCMYVLAQAGPDVYFDDTVTTNTIFNVNSTETFTETIQKDSKITLYNPVWVAVHGLFFTMFLIYFIWNMLQLLVKRD